MITTGKETKISSEIGRIMTFEGQDWTNLPPGLEITAKATKIPRQSTGDNWQHLYFILLKRRHQNGFSTQNEPCHLEKCGQFVKYWFPMAENCFDDGLVVDE